MDTMMNLQTITNLPKHVVDRFRYDPKEDRVSVVDVMSVLSGSSPEETACNISEFMIAYPDIAVRIDIVKNYNSTVAMCDFETLVKIIMAYPSEKLVRVRICAIEKLFTRDRVTREIANVAVAANSPQQMFVKVAEGVYHPDEICDHYKIDKKWIVSLARDLANEYTVVFKTDPPKCPGRSGHMLCNWNAYTAMEVSFICGAIKPYTKL